MNDEIIKKWVGGICIADKKVLLIYRINNEREFGKEYFVFPGGYVSDDEALEDALIREFKESSITVELGELVYSNEENDSNGMEYYYLCNYIAGSPMLTEDCEESKKMAEGTQHYLPMWTPLDELDDLIVYPESVKNYILENVIDEE